jgi:hypothetical protein
MTLNVVAGLLTITGYSVNDTIVIFDRVRENTRNRSARGLPLATIVNNAVNQTLSRTVITAGTTLLSVIALYLFGGEVLKGFAFTMLVGIISGTYSTVFIAAAIAIMLQGRKPLKGQVVVTTQAPEDAQVRRAEARAAARVVAALCEPSGRRPARDHPGAHRVPAGLELGSPDSRAGVLRLGSAAGAGPRLRRGAAHRHARGDRDLLPRRYPRDGAEAPRRRCRSHRRRRAVWRR